MITLINNLIDENLLLLSKSKDNSFNLKSFKDNCGKRLHDPKTFAKIMINKELINKKQNEEFSYVLTPIGKQISENGGWLKHLKMLNNIENEPKKPINKVLITFLTIAFLTFLFAFYYLTTNKK
jgi:hypothetical protein